MEKCDHSSLFCVKFWDIDGYYATCLACGFYVTGKTTEEVNEQLLPKEKPMTDDYNSGYKAGVEQATQPLYTTGEDFSHLYHPREINEKIGERRKKLLTKKVTKWVIALKGTLTHTEHVANGRMFDTEEQAKSYSEAYFGTQTLGVFSLEIEIPL